jgi:hypothetical protein
MDNNETEAHNLSEIIRRLTKRNRKWNQLQEYGRTGTTIKNIFELQLPSSFSSL